MDTQFLVTIMIFVYLGISAFFDCKWKRIPWCVQGMGAVFVCICLITQWQKVSYNYILAMIPGMILLLLAWVTKESIGYGDGVSVLLLGGMAGFKACVWVLCFSLILLSVVGLVLLVIKHMDKKTKIPYLPFLFAAQSFFVLLQYV